MQCTEKHFLLFNFYNLIPMYNQHLRAMIKYHFKYKSKHCQIILYHQQMVAIFNVVCIRN